MPSIFVWKSDTVNTSKKQIRYYSGSNWSLEDDDYSSKSYMFLDQIVIPGFNDSVITFNAKKMPRDWVGSELLEVTNIPYEHIKTDNYGTLEKIGEWMRFTSKNDIQFDPESLQNELMCIKKWMNENHKYVSPSMPLSKDKIQQQFQEFYMKYNIPLPKPTLDIKDTCKDTYKNIYNTKQYNKNNVFNNKNRDRF